MSCSSSLVFVRVIVRSFHNNQIMSIIPIEVVFLFSLRFLDTLQISPPIWTYLWQVRVTKVWWLSPKWQVNIDSRWSKSIITMITYHVILWEFDGFFETKKWFVHLFFRDFSYKLFMSRFFHSNIYNNPTWLLSLHFACWKRLSCLM